MMDLRTKISSSRTCKKRLEELFQPIEEKLENGDFSAECASDAYDEAINSVKEAYFATPGLGPMMNDQWDIFLKENTIRPVEMVDLDKPNDVDQPTDQVPHFNDQAPQGNEVAGARSGIAQTLPGDTDDYILQSISDPNAKAMVAKILKGAYMDKARETSRAACKARLVEVNLPINHKVNTSMYDGEEGHKLYQMDKAEAIKAYQNTPNLGLMKGTTLDDYLDAIQSERLIEKMDENAKRRAENDQDKIVKLLSAVMEHFQAFRKLFPEWLDNRSDNCNWLRLKADSLDKKQKTTNKQVVAGASVGAASTIAGIAIISVILAPVTFGGSLAIGLGVGSAAVGIGAGGANKVIQIQKRKYDTNNYNEALARLKTDKEQTDEMMSIINKLGKVAKKFLKELERREDDGASTGQVVAVPGIRTQLNSSTGNDHTPSSHTGQSAAGPATSTGPTTKLSSTKRVGVYGVGIGTRIGLQFTNEVVTAVKLADVASIALGGIFVCLIGAMNLAMDAYSLVTIIKDIKDGGKSELAKNFRERADELMKEVVEVVSASEIIEKIVIMAEDVMTPWLKRYPLTVGREDNE